jgi:hypothetical protein
MDIEKWLRSLGLQQYIAAFRENNVEADLVARLTAEDLKDIGVSSVSHRLAVASCQMSCPALGTEKGRTMGS